MQDVELLFDRSLICGRPFEVLIRATHATHHAFRIAMVRNIERREGFDLRAPSRAEICRQLQQIVRRHVLGQKERGKRFVVDFSTAAELSGQARTSPLGRSFRGCVSLGFELDLVQFEVGHAVGISSA
jgi:hypothetical protein